MYIKGIYTRFAIKERREKVHPQTEKHYASYLHTKKTYGYPS